jgi:hypothetical protein
MKDEKNPGMHTLYEYFTNNGINLNNERRW